LLGSGLEDSFVGLRAWGGRVVEDSVITQFGRIQALHASRRIQLPDKKNCMI